MEEKKEKEYDLEFLRKRIQQMKKEEEKRLELLKKELKADFEKKRRESRKISIIEGSFYSIMDGMGNRYISPYALSMGANTTQIGFLTAIPSLFGNISQLFSFKAMEKYSRKKIIILMTMLQAFMWLFIILVGVMFFLFGFKSNLSIWALILIYTVLITFGSFTSPIWSSWMRDLVDYDKSGKYFGTRNKILGFVGLVAMLAGGFILDYFKKTKIFIGFFILFFCAFVARLISSQLFRKKIEPKLKVEKVHYFSIWEFLKKARGNNFGRFVLAISAMNLVINLASPFFAVYMLRELKLSYSTYTLIIMSSILGNLIFMPVWGKIADKYGNIKILKLTSFMTFLIPFAWFLSFLIFDGVSQSLIIYLVFVEFLSGVIFSGFSLTSSNFIYDAVTREKMALCASYFNILSSVGVFIGATTGGFLANHIKLPISSILVLFLLSSILRIIVSTFLIRKINEVRMVEPFKFVDIKEKIKVLTPKRLWQYLGIFDFKIE